MTANDMGDELARIAEETQRCQACDLYIVARQAVPGTGDPHAEAMLIGEAPSAFDDRSGRPFSGPTGVFLDELLALAGMRREQVFLTNVVKHRLLAGRELTPQEIAACAPFLTRQIAAVNPILIVTLGRYALAHFLPKARISAIHGQARQQGGRVLLAMYNPAAALHREELRETVVRDFTHALPAALAEARRLAAEGKLEPGKDEPGPQQLSLF
ncbi:MAG TPA: uracil-DNA glycosylase [Ktedonobacterales bacterium]|nr:uracil-DNA glycosylase [Ktedonobacterales bacterium]